MNSEKEKDLLSLLEKVLKFRPEELTEEDFSKLDDLIKLIKDKAVVPSRTESSEITKQIFVKCYKAMMDR